MALKGDLEMNKTNDAVTLTSFDYSPGDKWSCGYLSLEADTPLGALVWEEVVPGPRHSDDSAELRVTLKGKEIPLDYISLDFEPPGKPGKWADKFGASGDELEAELKSWFDSCRSTLATLIEEEQEEEEETEDNEGN